MMDLPGLSPSPKSSALGPAIITNPSEFQYPTNLSQRTHLQIPTLNSVPNFSTTMIHWKDIVIILLLMQPPDRHSQPRQFQSTHPLVLALERIIEFLATPLKNHCYNPQRRATNPRDENILDNLMRVEKFENFKSRLS
jgi:hypothetical protein